MTDASSVPTTTGRAPDRSGLVIGILVLSAFVTLLNETILSVALRELTLDLDIPITTAQWLTSGFLLTMAVVIPTTGFLLERLTARQVFLISMSAFSLGTLVCAVATGFPMLLAGRVVQACGTAVMLPLLMTVVMKLVPAERRGVTMGTLIIVISVAPAVGPTIGGAVLSSLGWRWMFGIVLPLAVAALVAGAVLVRVDSETRSVPLDMPSVFLSTLGFGGVLFGLSGSGDPSAQPLPPWLSGMIGLVALALFTWRQLTLQRQDRALLDLRPFTHRRFAVALVLTSVQNMCQIGIGAILLPLFLQSVLHQSAFVSGLAVLPGGVVLAVLGRPMGALYDKIGARSLVIPGTIAWAVALSLFATLGSDSSVAAVIAIHVLLMAATSLMIGPLMTDALSGLPVHLYSHGSAIISTIQQLMGALGTALFVTIATLATVGVATGLDAGGLRAAFIVAGGVGVFGVICSLFVPKDSSKGTSHVA